jgi:hypothetical protein
MKTREKGFMHMARTIGEKSGGPIYVVRLKATDGDGARALKSFLKAAWRRHGLKALSVTEESEVPS